MMSRQDDRERSELQRYVDTMSAMDRKTRSGYHVTLGALIALLEAQKNSNALVEINYHGDANWLVRYPWHHAAHSYRGYYADLAFRPTGDPISVRKFLHLLTKKCLNKTFHGYKGGEFVMGPDTPLWVSSDSSECSQRAIIMTGVDPTTGTVVLHTKAIPF
jgi:hypothetical protein